ncbi:M56 family metallopeptidase [Colwellia sp. BRX10-3]|uniref:M56 family metallopeptidase n=1 Tax=Colwellia sp. BRX10-3 TaxID=2759844 RepID=UPI0015F71D9F|nr:M56 family metallopeptidase [Colwellia sp. BRX10-3]MBA6391047.1 M56 family metallopeptidase [Colwellia sp. BRX10-3]
MSQESLINSPLLAALAITLIHFLWQGVLIAVVLKALLSLISHQKSQLRYALSAMAMLANLILPTITFFLVYDSGYRQATNFAQALPLLDQNFYLEQIQANAWYMEWLEFLPLVTMAWLAIVSVLALKLIIELYNVNKLPLQGCTAVDIALQKRFDALISKVGLSRKVVLLLSSKTDVPMAIGWLKPVVLVPFSMLSGLTPQQLDMLLLHELAHIRRHDYLVNFLQTLVEILLFFHPAVSWVSKQMRNEREYCSDDIAVQHCGSSLAYAHTLADTASLCEKHRHHTIPSMAMAASGGDLKQRVVRLLDNQQHCTKTTDSGKWLASFTILLTIIFLFSKYSLTLPVIDLQSGSISLHNSATVLSKSAITHIPLAFEQAKTNTSIASRLLAIDNSSASEVSALKKTINSPQAIIESRKVIAKKSVDKSNSINKNPATPYYNELPFVSTNSSNKNNIAQQNVALKEAIQTNQYPTIAKTKSISQLAFERTDSKSKSATANPYKQQINALSNEPIIAKNTPIAVLNRTQYGLSYQEQADNNAQLRNTLFSPKKLSNSVVEHKSLQANTVAARLLDSIEPKYPASAKRKGIELEIMVEFNIDRNGLVKDIQFESVSKASYFRNTIRNAMEKWRFLPAKKNGRAVESKMSKIFSFSLLK